MVDGKTYNEETNNKHKPSHKEKAWIQILFEKLSTNGGQIMVPLDSYDGEGDYGFGKKFGWCEDRYGVSWQFVLSE